MTNTFKWIKPTKKYPSYNSFNMESFDPMFYKYLYLLLLAFILILLGYVYSTQT